MKAKERQSKLSDERKGERGAALVMVLMMSFLLLVAAIGLLLEASLNTANITDATSEEQAYYAAESGIQTVVDVLRGGTCPNPLYTTGCFPNDPDPLKITAPANKIDYFKAVRLATSNAAGDTSTVARLSRWLPYSDPTNPNSTVHLGGNPSPFRFRVEVENPDNMGNSITYRTDQRPDKMYSGTMPSGCVVNAVNQMVLSCLDPATTNTVRIEYVPVGMTTVNVASGEAPAALGSWRISGSGPSFDLNGASIPARIRFAIYVNMVSVQNTTKIIRGYLEPGLIKAGNIGAARVFYDSKNFVHSGSLITITDAYSGTIIQEAPPAAPTGEGGTYRTGFVTTPVAPAAGGGYGDTLVNSTMTAPEPTRLVIRSTGFGPHGAVKRLEAVIQKNYFNGLGAPSPLTLIGPPCTPVATCTPTAVAPSFVFQPGTSTGTRYDGKDIQLMAFLPPIGLTNDTNKARVSSRLIQPPPNKFNGSVFGTPSNIADELPFWLQNPRNLNATLMQLIAVADASGSLTKISEPRPPNPTGSTNYGDFKNASGITYIEGDLEFSGSGGGILVVTGTLTFKGGFDFNGLIVVVGTGGILRTGGGDGSLQGNIIVAPYVTPSDTSAYNWSLNTCMTDTLVTNKLNCFYAPRYDISGGGASDIVYNSNNVKMGLGALTNFVKGVAEK